jgi:hypothetical protein
MVEKVETEEIVEAVKIKKTASYRNIGCPIEQVKHLLSQSVPFMICIHSGNTIYKGKVLSMRNGWVLIETLREPKDTVHVNIANASSVSFKINK